MQDLAGKAWGRFQIIEERGRGGMAVVYKAYDGVLQRTVALKVLLPLLSSNAEFVQRFRREAITSANLRHPNIVVIYDVGAHEDYQYMVMEYLEGPTLQQEIELKGVLSLERTVSILGQLTEALENAHQQHLVHRDIKPANIIIGAQDHVTLTDFGLVKAVSSSKITGEGVAVGTLRYMSPEQAEGRLLDYRSDLYSLGVVVYEMLTGRTPYSGETPHQTLHELVYEPPIRPSTINPRVDPAVENALLQALAKEPGSRFDRAGAFAQALAVASGLRPSREWGGQTELLQRRANLRLLAADGREYLVYWGRVTVGRDTDNDIVIPDRQISRHHARIQCGSQGCTVTDRGSTNGTLVNGVRIQPEMPWPLRPEDVLQLGSVQLLVASPVSTNASAAGTTMTMPSDFD